MKEDSLTVHLGDRSYPIKIGRGLKTTIISEVDSLHKEGKKVVALIDQGLVEGNPEFCSKLLLSLPTFEVPRGETSKSVAILEKAWNFLATNRVDRSSCLFAIGGGVTGDLAGFAAASFLRGIAFYQVPTTLLAMVDSSVGGKTGINLAVGKNLVGSFHQPKKVFIDLEVLKTLPQREFSAGMAEVIKYGMLGNRGLYDRLLALGKPLDSTSQELAEFVSICCSDKASIVQADERETSKNGGGRALLNLGHTFAHAIEAQAGYGHYLHGEAVAIGLVCAFRLSRHLGFCEEEKEEDLLNLLKAYGLPDRLAEDLPMDQLMSIMQNDKKVIGGKLRFVVMKEMGCSVTMGGVEQELVRKVWQSVGAR